LPTQNVAKLSQPRIKTAARVKRTGFSRQEMGQVIRWVIA
jgi:hypothetical protein